MGELDGLTAIVTGGGRGIGAGIVTVLANEGARVAITGRDARRAESLAQAVRSSGGDAIALPQDVANRSSCLEVVAEVGRSYGPVDLLVNNAGISELRSFREMEEAAWDQMLAVNVKGAYLMAHAVLGDMMKRQAGTVINIGSLLSKTGAVPQQSHYIASKFAVMGLTQSLASELAPHGIRVNAVCPGVIRTEMWEEELRVVAAQEGISVDEAWANAIAPIPLGRAQQPTDIGHVVAFLASERARNITGETINVNGGQLMD